MAKCPHCGSENTESTNLGECVLTHTVAGALGVLAGGVAAMFHPSSGTHVAHGTWHSLTENVHLRHHCNCCKRDF